MAIEVGYVLPAGSWVAQDRGGTWYSYDNELIPKSSFFFIPEFTTGTRIGFLERKEPNPYWQSTLHQIQPGEVIYLSD